jgi:prepilin-type N-terminal cleavage/methylation domain-containing protein
VCGFTLIELMVTMSIVTVIMSVVLFSYSKFSDRLALTSAAQEMAIAMRQAQSYGLNVKESATGGGAFTSAFGFFVDPAGDPTHYIIFVDTETAVTPKTYYAGTGACGSSTTECLEKGTLRNGVVISKICDTSGACPANFNGRALHITFLRPNPDADINFTNSNGNIISGGSEDTAVITLASPQGSTITITVEKTGQISVK